ncbi:MAG: hypothetical protein Q8M31_14895, partial [Beijerinckiaceae bacterium]|nr:hypothetical protein [Beijerinckiaceae bacterium]
MNAFAAMLMLSMGVPLVLAALSLVLRRPRHLLPWGAAPGLAAAFASQGAEASLDFVLLGASMQLDLLGAVFLGFSSFVWLCAGGYAIAYLGDARERSFCAFWQLTLAGVAGAFLAADVALFYVSFAILSLAAFVLVAHERTPSTERAARIYIILAIAGETSLLLGLIISSAGAESMSISHV